MIEAAEHGRVLVLPAAGNVQHQPLGLERHFRDLVAVPLVGAEFVEAADDGGRHHGRAAEAGADRKIGGDFEIEAVGRLDQADHRFDQRQFAVAAERGQIFGFDGAAEIMRVDPDASVAAPAQRRMRIHRDGRVDDRAAVIVDEVMGEVGAAAGEADPDRRAGPRENLALFVELEQVAAEDVDQAVRRHRGSGRHGRAGRAV